jgi:hypothetical protein
VIGKLLVSLMTFACDQDDIARLRQRDGACNCFGAIGNFFKSIGTKSLFHFGNNRVRIFFSRIVGSNDAEVCILIRDFPHERTFFPVAIAAAPENNNETLRFEIA